jgi:hypothetical protein
MMVENIKDLGKMENNMEKENFIILKKVVGKEEFGLKEEELNGKIRLHLYKIKL